MNIKIDNEKVKGALNIAKVINNARRFVQKNTGIEVEKIVVFWTYDVGTDSFVITPNLIPGNYGGMILAGEDHDERDESVILHEYGHWVYGTVRDTGRFRSGTHSGDKEVDTKLSFSEGLATFFGQSILGHQFYFDGNNIQSSISDNIENPKKSKNITSTMKSELFVAAVLWDMFDNSKNNTESWDLLEEHISDIMMTNIEVILNAELLQGNPNDIKDFINTFMEYDITIEDIYAKYIENHITKNSEQAYEFWKIFNKNGMQFDKEKPKVSIVGTDDPTFVVIDQNTKSLDIELYDNVKVSKIEIWLDKKRIGFCYNPNNIYTFNFNNNIIKNGLNKLAIKVYDYAGNMLDSKNTISRSFPANDFFTDSVITN